MTSQYLVVGSPIEHSKSPAIHRAAYEVLGLDWQYGRLEVTKGGLRQVLDNAPDALRGFSVTMPLKEEAARNAVVADEFVQRSGAANTLLRAEDGWHAFNTDVYGIVKAIRPAIATTTPSILIVGSGATAYSAMMAAKLLGAADVRVFARNRTTRKSLVQFGREAGLKVRSVSRLGAAIKRVDFTISTLPSRALDSSIAKLANKANSAPNGGLLDVAYDPWPSAAATFWAASGQNVASGLDMLIWQAVAQLRIFTSGNPNTELANEIAVVEAMRHAV